MHEVQHRFVSADAFCFRLRGKRGLRLCRKTMLTASGQTMLCPCGHKHSANNKRRPTGRPLLLAEKQGFEPWRPFADPTPLAGEPLRPLGYFSNMMLAEREGFEPPVPCGITGFQDRRLKPLGHLSVPSEHTGLPIAEQQKYYIKWKVGCQQRKTVPRLYNLWNDLQQAAKILLYIRSRFL